MVKHMTLLAALFLIGACQTTQIVNSDTTGLPMLDSGLQHQTTDRFYDLMPSCVAVLPMQHQGPDLLPRALARYLSEKFDRVVGPAQTAAIADSQVLNLGQDQDRERFSRQTGCSTFLTVKPSGNESVYILAWSLERMGAIASLVDWQGAPLWQAAFVTARSRGGLSLDPLGMVSHAASATYAHQDQGKFASMADDVARRLVSTLPDMKTAL